MYNINENQYRTTGEQEIAKIEQRLGIQFVIDEIERLQGIISVQEEGSIMTLPELDPEWKLNTKGQCLSCGKRVKTYVEHQFLKNISVDGKRGATIAYRMSEHLS